VVALPLANSTSVGLSPVLEWTVGGNTAEYRIYLGKQPALSAENLVSTLTNHSFSSDTPIEHDSTYYWRVDTRNQSGCWTQGNVLSFSTITKAPPELQIRTSDSKGAVISFDAEQDTRYRVQRSIMLESWVTIDLLEGHGEPVEVEDANVQSQFREAYYRVIRERNP
jgi:hypothetical protein